MRQEHYQMLNGKYLLDSERLLADGDYPQASEKLWGAAAEMVKAVAEARGWRHYSHLELREAVQRLARETGDDELRRLFAVMESLHANFYENWMDGATVEVHANDARRLIEKLRPLAA